MELELIKYFSTLDPFGLKSDMIYAGKTVKVLTSKKVATKTAAKYHTVKSGDTVSTLAVKYGSTIVQIKSWNKIGQELYNF
ncbi:LysM peptidoglycan-binding domain-containing protein [Niallia circulans]|uniref:LysM peptidoglycan-binding domain-containing protein n=1 Tax=Niallia circulans TaxID=1397 RepID=UPI003D9548B4